MKKQHSVEQIVSKLRQADVGLGKGLNAPGFERRVRNILAGSSNQRM